MWLELIIGWLAVAVCVAVLNKRFWDKFPDHTNAEVEMLRKYQERTKVIE